MAEPTPFHDLYDYLAIRRGSGLVLSPDGRRLVTVVQELDEAGARYVSSLWEVDPAGERPARRLTRSAEGESAPVFRADGTLLFTSKRPVPGEDEKLVRLWALPPSGEAYPLAASPGGCAGPVAGGDVVVLATDRMYGADAERDEERRKSRDERKINAVLHEGFPIRYWDHEVGPDFPRLAVVDGDRLRDLTPDAGRALVNADYDVSADGRTVVTQWRVDERRGQSHVALAVIDVATGDRRTLVEEEAVKHGSPVISPNGRLVAALREPRSTFTSPWTIGLRLHRLDESAPVREIELDADLNPLEYAWSPDSTTLYVTGDRHGRGAVVAVDVASGTSRRLAADATYGSLCPSGPYVYAMRSAMDRPPSPVRLDATKTDQEPVYLPSPAPDLPLPGRVEKVTSTAPDGAVVHGWLYTPEGEGPAPLQVVIHGGPLMSWNSWSWRWNPWLEVARGWAVLLPDPALSTGYGHAWITRAWPHRAAEVWADVETLTDVVCARPEIDAARTACLGASFGGYMVNWIAGHTGRFRALVTHAGLWAADQQHTTTDAADWKTGLFGRPYERPEWYAENSPHHFVDKITTPVLITHGNRDYRVPYSESLRFWFDLVDTFDGEPDELPHRFLQLPGENHWVLGPGTFAVWRETIWAFLDRHVLGEEWRRPDLV